MEDVTLIRRLEMSRWKMKELSSGRRKKTPKTVALLFPAAIKKEEERSNVQRYAFSVVSCIFHRRETGDI